MSEQFYSVLLVDDEKEILEGIANSISWQDLGFNLIGTAENGIEALEIIDENEPDLVLTDIRMPFMDGLALAKVIHEKYLSTKVVIFSGYDDFEYAQEAIKYDTLEYIIKPVTAKKLSSSLLSIKERLDKDRKEKLNFEELKESYAASLPILQEQFIQRLLFTDTSEKELKYLAETTGLNFFKDQDAIYVCYFGINTKTADKQLMYFSLEENFNERYKDKFDYYISVRSDGLVLFIYGEAENSNTLALVDELNNFANYFYALTNVDIKGGLGKIALSYNDISTSYQEAYQAYQYASSSDINRVVYFSDIEIGQAEKFSFDGIAWDELTKAISMHSEAKINQAIDKFFSQYSDIHKDTLFLELLTRLMDLARTYDLDVDELIGSSQVWQHDLAKIHHIDDLAEWTREVALKISDALEYERVSSSENLIYRVKNYLKANYPDPNLSLESTSEYFHVSSTYLSSMFKKQTGYTYSSYLTKIRIEAAMKLLENTNDKTYEITEQVGYSDPNYFSYVFKKEKGLSPTSYRKAVRKAQK